MTECNDMALLEFRLNVRLIVLDAMSINTLTWTQELERQAILRLLKGIEKLKEEQHDTK